MKLSYKELQTVLRTAKDNGLTSIKLNAKQTVLQEEYDRITATVTLGTETLAIPVILPEVVRPLDVTTVDLLRESHLQPSSSYPFCENTVKVENNYKTRVLPAMDSSRAPSWLCRPCEVYVIDGIDYLPYELDMALTGAVCELAAPPVVSNAVIDNIESYGSNRQPVKAPTKKDIAAATSASKTNDRKIAVNAAPRLQTPARKDRVSNARQATPIVNVSKDLPKAKLTYSAEPASPYFIDTNHSRFTRTLGTTELQALRNAEDAVRGARRGLAAVVNIAKGFHKAQVERALKVAA